MTALDDTYLGRRYQIKERSYNSESGGYNINIANYKIIRDNYGYSLKREELYWPVLEPAKGFWRDKADISDFIRLNSVEDLTEAIRVMGLKEITDIQSKGLVGGNKRRRNKKTRRTRRSRYKKKLHHDR